MNTSSPKHVAIWKWLSAIATPAGTVLLLGLVAGVASAQTLLDPLTLTKYMDPLPVPGAMPTAGPNYYEIGVYKIQQRLHSQLPPTTLYGYGTSQATASYPGATIVARKGVPISIKWTNHLTGAHILSYAFDPTIPAAQTTTGVPIATHVHGAEVEPQSDGGPNTWFTAGFAEMGPDWKHQVYTYANNQLPATIWYHDHAFGFTRHNVYAGLAGFYVITDPGREPAGLPSGKYDIGLAIQDRMFTTDGQLWYPNVGETPERPVWIPEFFGNVILVNGKVWPYLNVEPRKYRFRILEGSNARFYSLWLDNRQSGRPGPKFVQIATDGGYLAKPVVLNDPGSASSKRLLMAPGERAEVIIDFSGYAPGTEFILKNNAKAPYPTGASVDPQTTGQIMMFRVVPLTATDHSVIPRTLTTVEMLPSPTLTRVMTLNEMQGLTGPVGALLNGKMYDPADMSVRPTLGTTEMWEIVNTTGDTHPIHLHLVQYQILNRQKLDIRKYAAAFARANPTLPTDTYVPVELGRYLKGNKSAPDANERGWKDTFRMNPGEVTRVLVRFAPQDGSSSFAFDATAEPGYVWHCHILEHEENDMMQPYRLQMPALAQAGAASPAVEESPRMPAVSAVELEQSRPNPAPGPMEIGFALPSSSWADMRVYDVAGREVRVLAAREFPAGRHTLTWDGRDAAGRQVPKGIYLYRIQAGSVVMSKRAIVF